MRRMLAVPLSMIMICACTRQVRSSSIPPKRIQPVKYEYAVDRNYKRHIANAADAGDGDAYVRILRQRMAADPSDLKTRLDLAAHYGTLGFPELTAEHYRLAHERFPDSAEAVLGLVKSLRAVELKAEALATLERYAGAHPQASANAHGWLGFLRDEAGELQAAEQSYRTAIEMGLRSDSVYNNLGSNLLEQGKREAAAEEFRKALEIAPRSVLARNNLGIALAQNPQQAVTELEAVSDRATAHNNLAAVMMESGRYPEARRELDVALGYKGNHPEALRNLRLLSDLEGQRVDPVTGRPTPVWKRWTRGVKRIVLGEDEVEKPASGAQAAAR